MKMSDIAIVLLVAISSICAVTVAQSGSGISSSCTSVLVTLSPCLNYITGNSTKPSASCCTQLGSVVKSSPECLCEVVNSGGGSIAAGLNINQTQALDLPNVCDIKTPSLSTCGKASASSPSGSPAGISPTTPSSVSSGGSKTTPTTEIETSDGNMLKLPKITMILAILYVTYHML